MYRSVRFERPGTGDQDGEEALVEISRWRHAVINFPIRC